MRLNLRSGPCWETGLARDKSGLTQQLARQHGALCTDHKANGLENRIDQKKFKSKQLSINIIVDVDKHNTHQGNIRKSVMY